MEENQESKSYAGFSPAPSTRELLLREWEVNIPPQEAKGLAADEAAVNYSLLGIKSAYILNGGAFVALPALVEPFGICLATQRHDLWVAAGCFLSGLVCAAFANCFSYFTMCQAGALHFNQRAIIAIDVLGLHDENYRTDERNIKSKSEAAENVLRCQLWWKRLRVLAIIAALGSLATFVGGAFMLLVLASRY